jgi:hypothetical protein
MIMRQTLPQMKAQKKKKKEKEFDFQIPIKQNTHTPELERGKE